MPSACYVTLSQLASSSGNGSSFSMLRETPPRILRGSVNGRSCSRNVLVSTRTPCRDRVAAISSPGVNWHTGSSRNPLHRDVISTLGGSSCSGQTALSWARHRRNLRRSSPNRIRGRRTKPAADHPSSSSLPRAPSRRATRSAAAPITAIRTAHATATSSRSSRRPFHYGVLAATAVSAKAHFCEQR